MEEHHAAFFSLLKKSSRLSLLHPTHLAANTFPDAFTRQIPTLRRYSCTCRTATDEEGGGAAASLREEEEEEELGSVDGDDDEEGSVADVAFEEEGTAAAADWGDGVEPVLLLGVGAAPAEAAAKTAERMGVQSEREREKKKGKEKNPKMVLFERKKEYQPQRSPKIYI